MELTFLRFMIWILAQWRITEILKAEDSPFHIVSNIRNYFHRRDDPDHTFLGAINKWFECIYCGSIGFGFVLVFFPYLLMASFNSDLLWTLDIFYLVFAGSKIIILGTIIIPEYIGAYITAKQKQASALVRLADKK